MKKKIILIVIIFIPPFILLMGCWNYDEVNHLRIVAGLAIDYDQTEDLYTITVEVIKVSSQEADKEMSGETFESKGISILDATRNIIAKTGRRLYWSDAAVVIISEEIAKKGIIPALDILMRGMEIRNDILILISHEKTASEILVSRNIKSHKIISYHLENILNNENSTSQYFEVPLWRFVKDLLSGDISPSCPGVKISTYDNNSVQQIGEVAIFKEDTLKGWIDEDDSIYFLWATDKLKGGVLPISVNEDSQQFRIAFNIITSSTRRKAQYIDNELTVNLDINTNVSINEVSGKFDFSNSENLKVLESIVEEQIKKGVNNIIDIIQKDYNSDVLGVGLAVKKDMPQVWKKEIKPNWDVIFPKLKIKVNVNVKIRGSSITTKPIDVQD